METSNEFISFAAGFIGSFVFQWVKGKTGWEGDKAYWLAFALSVIIAAGGVAFAGDLDLTITGVFASLAAVLGGAQLAFRLIVSPESLVRSFFAG